MKYKLNTTYKKLLADTPTPVSIYLKLRDKFPNSILLESSDYHGNENSFSYICCNPIAGIKLENNEIRCTYPNGGFESHSGNELKKEVPGILEKFIRSFE